MGGESSYLQLSNSAKERLRNWGHVSKVCNDVLQNLEYVVDNIHSTKKSSFPDSSTPTL